MCYQINSEFILANYFLYSEEPLTFGMLRKLRTAIESQITECYVDISTPSLESTIELYPQFFRWIGNFIGRADGSDHLFEDKHINDNFNWEISEDAIRTKVVKVIQEAVTR
jgi:hypothetical protein